MNWLYVVPGPSMFDLLPEHWNWVRLSLGHTAADSADAWVALRDAQDTFWRYEVGPFGPKGRPWQDRPWVRNYERWLVQRDVGPRAIAHRSRADVHRNVLERDNGTALEGLKTSLHRGNDSLAFDLDDAFLGSRERADVLVKVTYLDSGDARWWVRASGGTTPPVTNRGSHEWKTATFRVNGLRARDSLPGGTDLWVTTSRSDLTVRFVRVIRLHPPT